MSKIVYKQSYKPRADPSTPGLNVRHLNYIATRPGTVYNKGCGFGLWGHLPGEGGIRIQNDLEGAKKIVREASEERTLYRAVISVGKDDARANGLYLRSNWEKLINDHVGVIAKEMDIKPENFCWCASMHYAKHHPHVHILYWDNGTDPRPEFIVKEAFDRKTERIRAEFSGEIHREEIRENQLEQRAELKQLRTMIQAMCLDANPEKALDLNRLLNGDKLEGLSKMMLELIQDLPARGSLRYAYLPPAYKKQVDQLVKACLEVPELAKEFGRYEFFTRQISELYSNDATGTAENLENARGKLYKELANQVMDAIRDIKLELIQSAPADRQEIGALLQTAVTEVVAGMESYRRLKELLPDRRIPVKCMEKQITGYYDQMNKVVGEALMDARIRLRLQSFALSEAFQPDREKSKESDHSVCGRKLTDEEWERYQEVYREVKRALRREITAMLRQDVGWQADTVKNGTASLLCGMMRLLSQSASQKQSGAARARLDRRLRSRDKSREAQKDQKAIHAAGSEWESGY